MLRNQNDVAKAGTERRQKAQEKRRIQSPEPRSATSSPSSVVMYKPIAESQDTYAHCFFVSAYIYGPRDPWTHHGYLELMPHFFNSMRPGSALAHAFAVVSHCYYGAWQPDIRDIETAETRRVYTKALNALREALQDPQQSTSDETLMAVCLLAFFQVRQLVETLVALTVIAFPSILTIDPF